MYIFFILYIIYLCIYLFLCYIILYVIYFYILLCRCNRVSYSALVLFSTLFVYSDIETTPSFYQLF